MIDPRKVPGSVVFARAKDVLGEHEAGRRYGLNRNTKMLKGEVISAIYKSSDNSTKKACRIIANYDVGNKIVRKEIGIRLVKAYAEAVAVSVADPPPEEIEEAKEEAKEETKEEAKEEAELDENLNDNQQPTDVIITNTNATIAASPMSTNASVDTTILDTVVAEIAAEVEQPINNHTIETINVDDTVFMFGEPAANNHGQDWYDNCNATLSLVNGPVPYRPWSIIHGDSQIGAGANIDKHLSRLDVFKISFPPKEINTILRCTNVQLIIINKHTTTRKELFKVFGILILITKHEFGSRGDLWNESPPSKYEGAPRFGRTGMSKNRFEDLIRCFRWSEQPPVRPEDMTSEHYRWLLVDDFVEAFNSHRETNFVPSDRICVDESMSRWYGQGGSWINIGLPNYVAIDRKPDSGCEIQSSCCGRSGIMLRLRLVKTKREEEAIERDHNNNQQDLESENHGTKVLKFLVRPWFYRPRIVCADSYFASVNTAEALLMVNLRFIGVIKTATRRFPMKALGEKELVDRGDRYGLVSIEAGRPKYLAFVFVDRNRQYFIATAGSLDPGEPCIRTRWRQLAHVDSNLPPEQLRLEIPQPNCSAIYYNTCAKIDNHNRDRSDTLRLEKKFATKDWATRVNHAVFGMVLVDCWKMYANLTYPLDESGKLNIEETQKDFYGNLATELIDNNEDGRSTRSSGVQPNVAVASAVDTATGLPVSGIGPHLTPTRHKRKLHGRVQSKQKKQGRCRVCPKGVSTMVCSVCKAEGNEVFICNTDENSGFRMCFAQHMEEYHPDLCT
jgi:hypothetical protein